MGEVGWRWRWDVRKREGYMDVAVGNSGDGGVGVRPGDKYGGGAQGERVGEARKSGGMDGKEKSE